MKIAVIIPALNEAGWIGHAVDSVAAQPGEHETIVVDGGSTDGTVGLVRRHARVLTAPRGRGSQMNTGATAAEGDVLLFLHADSVLHARALTGVRDALRDPAVAGGTFTLRFDGDHWLLRAYAWLTRFHARLLHYGDQGIFVRRSAFEQLGGFRDYALMEDVDFLRRMERLGRRIVVPCPVTTSARRFAAGGVVRRQALNIGLVLLFTLGVPPATLARWYDRGRFRNDRLAALRGRSDAGGDHPG